MLAGAIFLTLALAVVVTLYIVLPLWEERASDELVPRKEVLKREYQRSALLADRDRLLSALLELDADYELNKIPPGEYAPLRERLVREAAQTLRHLDEINLAGRQPRTTMPGANSATDEADDLEELIALRKQELSEIHQGHNEVRDLPAEVTGFQAYCTYCGKPLMSGDRFCPSCGSRIPS